MPPLLTSNDQPDGGMHGEKMTGRRVWLGAKAFPERFDMAINNAAKVGAQASNDPGADNVIFLKGTQQQSSRTPQESDKNEIFYEGAGACLKQKGKEGRKWVDEEHPFAPPSHKCEWCVNNLTATELKDAYPSEYSSWKNRKHDCKEENWEWDPDFNRFRDFLRILGPKPAPSYTLDRDDYSILAYTPGNCHWRSKRAQTRNRGNTKLIEDSQGTEHTWAEWAKITKIKASTLRGRYAGGWSIDDTLHTPVGERRDSFNTKSKPLASNGLWGLFDRLLREEHDQAIVIATGKDRKMLDGIKKRFEEEGLDPHEVLEHVLTNWREFKYFAKEYGVWKDQSVPTVQLMAWSPSLNAMANFFIEHRHEIEAEREREEHQEEKEKFILDHMIQDPEHRILGDRLDQHNAKKSAPDFGVTADDVASYKKWFEATYRDQCPHGLPNRDVWTHLWREYQTALDQHVRDYGLEEAAEKAWKNQHIDCS